MYTCSVFIPLMELEAASQAEALSTHTADVRLLLCVHPLVDDQGVFLGKGFPARVALKRLLSAVEEPVRPESSRRAELLTAAVAALTFPLPVLQVAPLMFPQRVVVDECFAADVAHERLADGVHLHVALQDAGLVEAFAAHVAQVGFGPRVDQRVSLQVHVMAKFSAAHLTLKRL